MLHDPSVSLVGKTLNRTEDVGPSKNIKGSFIAALFVTGKKNRTIPISIDSPYLKRVVHSHN
jgi:hypothetical protein